MTYDYNDVKLSQEIFYHLLRFHELSEEADNRLFRAYFENESIQELTKSQAEAAQCKVERYGDVVYQTFQIHFLDFQNRF